MTRATLKTISHLSLAIKVAYKAGVVGIADLRFTIYDLRFTNLIRQPTIENRKYFLASCRAGKLEYRQIHGNN